MRQPCRPPAISSASIAREKPKATAAPRLAMNSPGEGHGRDRWQWVRCRCVPCLARMPQNQCGSSCTISVGDPRFQRAQRENCDHRHSPPRVLSSKPLCLAEISPRPTWSRTGGERGDNCCQTMWPPGDLGDARRRHRPGACPIRRRRRPDGSICTDDGAICANDGAICPDDAADDEQDR